MEGVRLIHLANSDTLLARLNAVPEERRTAFERTTGPESGYWSHRVPRLPRQTPNGVNMQSDITGRTAAEAALVTDPGGPAAYNQGVGLLAAGKFDEAKRQFEEAISEDGQYAPSYVGLGRVHMKQGTREDAKYYLKKALKRSPGSPSALMALSDVAMQEEDWGDLKKWSGQILVRDPDNPEALYRLAIALPGSRQIPGDGNALVELAAIGTVLQTTGRTKAPQYRDVLLSVRGAQTL